MTTYQSMSKTFKDILRDYSVLNATQPQQEDYDKINVAAAITNDNLPSLNKVSDYHQALRSLNTRVRAYLSNLGSAVVESSDRLINEERYDNRVHPENAVISREVFYGYLPAFRVSSLPYILTAGVVFSLLSIFLIFQMMGVTGQFNLPVSAAMFNTLYPPAGAVRLPFYKNPVVLGGIITILIAGIIALGIMYYKKS